MKSLSLSVIVIGLVLSATCIAPAQAPTQYNVHLKNGSVVKGRIVEVVPEKSVKILMVDGQEVVYAMTEVEKIEKEETPAPASNEEAARATVEGVSLQPAPERTEFPVAIYGGLSLPVGDFAKTSGSTAGLAKTGFAVGADVNIPLAPSIGWMSSAALSLHSLDVGYIPSGVSVDVGSWTLIWVLTGVRFSAPISPDATFYFSGQAGLLFGSYPSISVNTSLMSGSQESASATAFAFGFGAGITVKHLMLGARFLGSQPEYTILGSVGGTSLAAKQKQPTACVLISAGVTF